jgi:two-component system, OmpR family, copper resistance phosphate regulon response regulator CusR
MKLLVIEDDPKTAALMSKGLASEGFSVEVCLDGEEGLEQARASQPDAIILDVMLPLLDGWAVLTRLRESGVNTPVLMLTARDAVEHRVRGLTLGADDYITKPFALSELLARIRSVLRRSRSTSTEELKFSDLAIDQRRHRVTRDGQQIDLSAKEFALLQLLMEHQGEVLTRTFIAERVWSMMYEGDSNVVDVNIRRLRTKVDDPFSQKLIHTVRGRGYVIRQ